MRTTIFPFFFTKCKQQTWILLLILLFNPANSRCLSHLFVTQRLKVKRKKEKKKRSGDGNYQKEKREKTNNTHSRSRYDLNRIGGGQSKDPDRLSGLPSSTPTNNKKRKITANHNDKSKPSKKGLKNVSTFEKYKHRDTAFFVPSEKDSFSFFFPRPPLSIRNITHTQTTKNHQTNTHNNKEGKGGVNSAIKHGTKKNRICLYSILFLARAILKNEIKIKKKHDKKTQ